MPVNKNNGYHTLSKDLSERIEQDRANHLVNPYACPDSAIIRRFCDHDKPHLWRPAFVMDVEKILHNNYYNRYSDKTQVISCYKNDDISRRALHVQLVSRIARTIGMTLGLNLDLIEAISLGHDIGHTPFGHAGERFLNALYNGHTGRLFNHNIHSARVLVDCKLISYTNIKIHPYDISNDIQQVFHLPHQSICKFVPLILPLKKHEFPLASDESFFQRSLQSCLTMSHV